MSTISIKDLGIGQIKPIEVEGKSLLVCRTQDGFYVIDDTCTHDNGPLKGGCLHGNEIECPRHGARFDVTTGEVRALPAPLPIRSYPVVVEGDVLTVKLQ